MGLIVKSDGQVLYAANLNDNLSFGIEKTAQNLINAGDATYSDNSYLNPDLKTEGDIDSANSTMIFENGFAMAFTGEIYDTPNSSVDSSKWTTAGGSASESASSVLTNNYENGYVQVFSTTAVTNIIRVNTTTGLDMKNGTSISQCAFKATASKASSAGNPGNFFTLLVTDGSNTATIYTTSAGTANQTAEYYFVLTFDGSAEEVAYKRYDSNGTLSGSGTVDLSTLTGGKYYLEMNQTGIAGINFFIRFHGLYYAKNNTIPSATLQTTATTLTESKSSGWGGFYGVEGVTSPTYSISANGGSNFDTFTNKEATNITNAGTSGVLKFETGESNNATIFPKVNRIVGFW